MFGFNKVKKFQLKPIELRAGASFGKIAKYTILTVFQRNNFVKTAETKANFMFSGKNKKI